jgi:hypothetical protein
MTTDQWLAVAIILVGLSAAGAHVGMLVHLWGHRRRG